MSSWTTVTTQMNPPISKPFVLGPCQPAVTSRRRVRPPPLLLAAALVSLAGPADFSSVRTTQQRRTGTGHGPRARRSSAAARPCWLAASRLDAPQVLSPRCPRLHKFTPPIGGCDLSRSQVPSKNRLEVTWPILTSLLPKRMIGHRI